MKRKVSIKDEKPSNRIREIRIQTIDRKTGKPFTQEGLADVIGTDYQQIQKLEKPTIPLTHTWMIRLARALGCEPYELIKSKAEILGEEFIGQNKYNNMKKNTELSIKHTITE